MKARSLRLMSNGADVREAVHALQALVLAQRASLAEQRGENDRLRRECGQAVLRDRAPEGADRQAQVDSLPT